MPPPDAATLPDDWVTKPVAAPAQAAAQTSAPSSAELPDDWVTAPARPSAAPVGDLAAQAIASATPKTQVGADFNALGQGLVSGTGSLIAGVGRIFQSARADLAAKDLAAFDLVDQGKNVATYGRLNGLQRAMVDAYSQAGPDERAAMRAGRQQLVDAAATPNMATRAGMAVEGFAPKLFPVAPENEGFQTGVARMVGGVAPALAAGVAGGPTGVLGAMAVIGSQTYDGAYQDAIAKGATPAVADDAAGKSALVQAASTVLPVNRLLKLVPVPLRDGLTATLVNLGRHGLELGSGNALGTFAQNYVAQQTYDPNRSLLEGIPNAGLDGFVSGLVIRGAGTVVGSGRAPGPSVAPVAPRASTSVDDVMKAPDINTAIAAASAASQVPSGSAPSGAASPSEAPAVRTSSEALAVRTSSEGRAVRTTSGESTAPTWGNLFSGGPDADVSGSRPTILTLSSGAKVPVQYDVVEARDLTPASGDLQPRDRAGRMASTGQIVNIASNLDPELLHASPGPDQGAPTVNADGVVLSGNGRTAAIKQAYALGNAGPYRDMIERFGFDTSGMTAPVLVRRIVQDMTPEQQRQFAIDSNVGAGQRLSGTEQAAIDARSLTPDLLSLYNPLLTGGATAAGNRDFVRSWVATLPQNDRNAVMGSDGSLSADGVRRLQGAMLSLAYGDKGTLSRSLESTDDNTRALTGALTDAAPAWAQLQAEITAGRVPQTMNVAPQLLRAVELVRQAREKGQSASDVLAQSDAFNPIDPVTAGFVRAFFNPLLTRAASRPLVAEVLRRYATAAAKTSTDAGLFGDALPAVQPADVLATVLASARKDPPVLPEASEVAAPGAGGSTETTSATTPRGTFSTSVTSDDPATRGAVIAVGQQMAGAVPSGQITASQVQARDGVGYGEAVRRANAENAAAAVPTQSAGAAASRDNTPVSQLTMAPDEFLANRYQGEVERLAAPPAQNDQNVYIPGVKSTLAEVTGDPVAAMDQAYNRQQPEAMTQHIARENQTADLVAAYYADTAGSAQELLRMERARDATAQQNIRRVFGDPNAARPPADPSPTLTLMQGILKNPRQAERASVIKTISDLASRFYGPDGKLKTDPYVLYGIGEHINDLLAGVGDTETSSAARVLKRELTQIKNSLYTDIEGAAPGFAQYRADYQRDSQAIDALKLLQDERLSLLSGTSQHITPAKWFTFMRGIVEGRADPMDPASSLSEDQMDRLWNITDQLKRQTFIDAGKPRGSWTSMMQEWGGRFARLGAHAIAAHALPIVGNLGVEMGTARLRARSVRNEMDRVLNPVLRQPGP